MPPRVVERRSPLERAYRCLRSLKITPSDWRRLNHRRQRSGVAFDYDDLRTAVFPRPGIHFLAGVTGINGGQAYHGRAANEVGYWACSAAVNLPQTGASAVAPSSAR